LSNSQLLSPEIIRRLERTGYPAFVAENKDKYPAEIWDSYLLRHFIAKACMYVPGFTYFRKWNVLTDWAIGLIGERGSGKSTTGAHICVHDCMMLNFPCWSNLKIRARLVIDERMEQALWEIEHVTGIELKYNAPVIYESLPLDAETLLSPECPYRGGYIYVDELNIELSDAWRTMSNDALASSDLMQTLRKLQSALLFSCISEMFVPNRVRDAADVYFRLQDYSFINESNLYGQRQGLDYKMDMYLMSSRFAGTRNMFSSTHQPYMTMQVHGKNLWGIVDTWDRKARKKHHSRLYGDKTKDETTIEEVVGGETIPDDELEIVQSQIVEDEQKEWGWLYRHPFIREMLATGREIKQGDFLDRVAKDAPVQVSKPAVIAHFEDYLNPNKRRASSGTMYSFGEYDRLHPPAHIENALIPA
jgi:hypothetical protein